MNVNELLNVYFYALYDEDDHQAHSGLVANYCEAAVRGDIFGNYIKPRYITIHRVPELVGVYDQEAGCTTIVNKNKQLKISQKIGCNTCAFYAKCTREPIDGLECCEDWREKA